MTVLIKEDIEKLFDKNPNTTVTMASGVKWTFRFKMPLSIKRIKVVDTNNKYLPNLSITVYTPEVGDTGIEHTEQPAVVDDEIASMSITNNGDAINVANIIMEDFQHNEIFPQIDSVYTVIGSVTVTGTVEVEYKPGGGSVPTSITTTEAQPLNVLEDGELVAEDIKYIIETVDEESRQLSDDEVGQLFDKNCDTFLVLQAQTLWTIKLKKPMRLKEILAVDQDNFLLDGLGMAFIGVDEVRHPAADYYIIGDMPVFPDIQVSYILLFNTCSGEEE